MRAIVAQISISEHSHLFHVEHSRVTNDQIISFEGDKIGAKSVKSQKNDSLIHFLNSGPVE